MSPMQFLYFLSCVEEKAFYSTEICLRALHKCKIDFFLVIFSTEFFQTCYCPSKLARRRAIQAHKANTTSYDLMDMAIVY